MKFSQMTKGQKYTFVVMVSLVTFILAALLVAATVMNPPADDVGDYLRTLALVESLIGFPVIFTLYVIYHIVWSALGKTASQKRVRTSFAAAEAALLLVGVVMFANDKGSALPFFLIIAALLLRFAEFFASASADGWESGISFGKVLGERLRSPDLIMRTAAVIMFLAGMGFVFVVAISGTTAMLPTWTFTISHYVYEINLNAHIYTIYVVYCGLMAVLFIGSYLVRLLPGVKGTKNAVGDI